MSRVFEESDLSDKSGSCGGSMKLEKCKFSYDVGMQKQWVESSAKFLDYVGARLGQSAKASLEAGEVIVTEVDTSILPIFETKKAMEEHIESLKFWEQEQCSREKENFNKFEVNMRQKLSTVHGVLFSVCEISLRSRLETESRHQVGEIAR